MIEMNRKVDKSIVTTDSAMIFPSLFIDSDEVLR